MLDDPSNRWLDFYGHISNPKTFFIFLHNVKLLGIDCTQKFDIMKRCQKSHRFEDMPIWHSFSKSLFWSLLYTDIWHSELLKVVAWKIKCKKFPDMLGFECFYNTLGAKLISGPIYSISSVWLVAKGPCWQQQWITRKKEKFLCFHYLPNSFPQD